MSKNIRAVIKGFYGYGNFGDDILMMVTYNLVEKFGKGNLDISVQCKEEDEQYIQNMLSGSKTLSINESISADIVIHGGGGVFFDFLEGSFLDTAINIVMKMLGFKRFTKYLNWLRTLRKIPVDRFKVRVGLGIGVGTFTVSSNKLRTSILAMSTFDFLMVRDIDSKKNFSHWNRLPVQVGTDLAFAEELWNKSFIHSVPVSTIKKIGFCIRHWPKDVSFQELAARLAFELKEQYEVHFFVLDEKADEQLIDDLSSFDLHIWKPSNDTLEDYLKIISSMDVFCTSRAHGAIISGILGIPSIIFEIEPKLRTVHEMLPSGTILLQEPSSEAFFLAFDEMKKHYVSYTQGVKSDVKSQKEILQKSVDNVGAFFRSLNIT